LLELFTGRIGDRLHHTILSPFGAESVMRPIKPRPARGERR
jgi:hypothetical protein